MPTRLDASPDTSPQRDPSSGSPNANNRPKASVLLSEDFIAIQEIETSASTADNATHGDATSASGPNAPSGCGSTSRRNVPDFLLSESEVTLVSCGVSAPGAVKSEASGQTDQPGCRSFMHMERAICQMRKYLSTGPLSPGSSKMRTEAANSQANSHGHADDTKTKGSPMMATIASDSLRAAFPLEILVGHGVRHLRSVQGCSLQIFVPAKLLSEQLKLHILTGSTVPKPGVTPSPGKMPINSKWLAKSSKMPKLFRFQFLAAQKLSDFLAVLGKDLDSEDDIPDEHEDKSGFLMQLFPPIMLTRTVQPGDVLDLRCNYPEESRHLLEEESKNFETPNWTVAIFFNGDAVVHCAKLAAEASLLVAPSGMGGGSPRLALSSRFSPRSNLLATHAQQLASPLTPRGAAPARASAVQHNARGLLVSEQVVRSLHKCYLRAGSVIQGLVTSSDDRLAALAARFQQAHYEKEKQRALDIMKSISQANATLSAKRPAAVTSPSLLSQERSSSPQGEMGSYQVRESASRNSATLRSARLNSGMENRQIDGVFTPNFGGAVQRASATGEHGVSSDTNSTVSSVGTKLESMRRSNRGSSCTLRSLASSKAAGDPSRLRLTPPAIVRASTPLDLAILREYEALFMRKTRAQESEESLLVNSAENLADDEVKGTDSEREDAVRIEVDAVIARVLSNGAKNPLRTDGDDEQSNGLLKKMRREAEIRALTTAYSADLYRTASNGVAMSNGAALSNGVNQVQAREPSAKESPTLSRSAVDTVGTVVDQRNPSSPVKSKSGPTGVKRPDLRRSPSTRETFSKVLMKWRSAAPKQEARRSRRESLRATLKGGRTKLEPAGLRRSIRISQGSLWKSQQVQRSPIPRKDSNRSPPVLGSVPVSAYSVSRNAKSTANQDSLPGVWIKSRKTSTERKPRSREKADASPMRKEKPKAIQVASQSADLEAKRKRKESDTTKKRKSTKPSNGPEDRARRKRESSAEKVARSSPSKGLKEDIDRNTGWKRSPKRKSSRTPSKDPEDSTGQKKTAKRKSSRTPNKDPEDSAVQKKTAKLKRSRSPSRELEESAGQKKTTKRKSSRSPNREPEDSNPGTKKSVKRKSRSRSSKDSGNDATQSEAAQSAREVYEPVVGSSSIPLSPATSDVATGDVSRNSKPSIPGIDPPSPRRTDNKAETLRRISARLSLRDSHQLGSLRAQKTIPPAEFAESGTERTSPEYEVLQARLKTLEAQVESLAAQKETSFANIFSSSSISSYAERDDTSAILGRTLSATKRVRHRGGKHATGLRRPTWPDKSFRVRKGPGLEAAGAEQRAHEENHRFHTIRAPTSVVRDELGLREESQVLPEPRPDAGGGAWTSRSGGSNWICLGEVRRLTSPEDVHLEGPLLVYNREPGFWRRNVESGLNAEWSVRRFRLTYGFLINLRSGNCMSLCGCRVRAGTSQFVVAPGEASAGKQQELFRWALVGKSGEVRYEFGCFDLATAQRWARELTTVAVYYWERDMLQQPAEVKVWIDDRIPAENRLDSSAGAASAATAELASNSEDVLSAQQDNAEDEVLHEDTQKRKILSGLQERAAQDDTYSSDSEEFECTRNRKRRAFHSKRRNAAAGEKIVAKFRTVVNSSSSVNSSETKSSTTFAERKESNSFTSASAREKTSRQPVAHQEAKLLATRGRWTSGSTFLTWTRSPGAVVFCSFCVYSILEARGWREHLPNHLWHHLWHHPDPSTDSEWIAGKVLAGVFGSVVALVLGMHVGIK